jgi:hypothetical protein
MPFGIAEKLFRTELCDSVERFRSRSNQRRLIVRGDLSMVYRVYSGPPGQGALSALERAEMLYKEFDTFDDALAWARHVTTTGRTALSIEGDDGTVLSKQEIAAALLHAEHAPSGRTRSL